MSVGVSDGDGASTSLAALDVTAVRHWAVHIRAALAARRAEIDALNVFPVPDGDTGTNLYLTFDAALDRLRQQASEPTGAAALLTEFAQSLLWTARGNSGVILSQVVRGFAEGCDGAEAIDVPVLARALARADERAWQGVTDPKEGTILSVSRAAAEAAARQPADLALATAVSAIRDAAQTALDRTPDQLPVLARAGVVDAGGAGLLLVFEALERVCTGGDLTALLELGGPARHPWTRPPTRSGDAGAPSAAPGAPGAADGVAEGVAAGVAGAAGGATEAGPGEAVGAWHQVAADCPATSGATSGAISGATEAQPEDGTPEFEVMYLLADSTEERVATLRARLVELGDSVLVVGGGDLWNIHAHVDDAGAAVEAGLTAGRPHRIRITSLLTPAQVLAQDHSGLPLRAGGSGIVACSAGAGIAAVFRAVGALTIPSGPGGRASTGQFIEAIRQQHAAGVAGVIVLPNDGDTELAAAAAVRAVADEGIEAHLVRARTAVQGIAALAVFERDQPAASNALAMQAAASATRHGGVTVSNREALTSGGHCVPGDILGIIDGDIVIIGSDQEAVGVEVVHRLVSSGGELLTIVTGKPAPPGLAAAIVKATRAEALGFEVTLIDGGQEVYSVLLGVE